jgi:sugar O-acyltransferase (sialic acid O-acetyltransferase NeuD family)
VKKLSDLVGRPLLIYGAGKTASILASYINASGGSVAAFTVESVYINTDEFSGRPLIDFECIAEHYPPNAFEIIIAVGYHEMNKQRQRIFNLCKTKGYRLASYVHPSVTYFNSDQISEGCVLFDHVTIQPGAHIGKNSFVWSNSVIAHDSKVESHCWIAAGSIIAGDVIVSENCFLGVNSTIGHNVILGAETFVGANTLVSKNTDKNTTIISAGGEKIRLNSQQFLKFANL